MCSLFVILVCDRSDRTVERTQHRPCGTYDTSMISRLGELTLLLEVVVTFVRAPKGLSGRQMRWTAPLALELACLSRFQSLV